MGEFGLALDRFVKGAVINMDQVGRKVALDMTRRIIMRTPVRTGRARGNWIATIGGPAQMTPGLAAVDDTDRSGRETIAAALGTIQAWRPSEQTSFFLANNLPYIEELERGSSRQAPVGMLAITVAEFGGVAKDAAAEAQAGTFGGSRSALDMGGAWDIGGVAD